MELRRRVETAITMQRRVDESRVLRDGEYMHEIHGFAALGAAQIRDDPIVVSATGSGA
jgi:hypothetical protein